MKKGLLVAILSVPAALGAQREPLRQPTSVPVELAAALAMSASLGASNDPQILVGELPDRLASRVQLPSGAVVLGSAFAGTTVVGIVQTLEGDDPELVAMDSALQKKGWRRPPEWPGAAVGGFRLPAGSGTPTRGRPATYCAFDGMLSVTRGVARHGRQTLIFRMTGTPNQGFGVCNPPPGRRPSSPLPTLFHPRGAIQERSAMGPDCDNERFRMGSTNGTGDRIRTSVPPDSLLAHYGRQMADSGWTLGNASWTAAQYWTRTDSAGRKQMVELKVGTSSASPDCRDLSLLLFAEER